MDGIEKAIRGALEKGDAGDRGFREEVYRKAFGALDRALQKNPNVTVEAAIRRRNELKQRISEIEQEFIPPPEPITPTLGPESEMLDAPRLDAADRSATFAQPVARRSARGRFATAFVVATLLATVGIGGWWAFTGNLFLSDAERDTSVPNPPAVLEEEDYTPDESGPPASGGPPALSDTPPVERDWIAIFDPSDPTRATAAGDASAELVQVGEESALRIRSGPSGSAVLFDIGQGVLEQLAGRRAVFVIEAGVGEGDATSVAVDCNFGGLGDCGRKRYVVDSERGDFLFEVDLPDRAPGAAGAISITSDVEGDARSLDVYAIRAAVSE